MIDFLYSIDLKLFYFINHSLSNPAFDKFFPFITDVKNWYIAYFILLGIAIFKGGRTGKVAAFAAILLIAFSDQFSSAFLKNIFQRIRPCNALPDVNLLTYCSGSYSFPSSHAVNNFAVAVFFGRIFPNLKKTLIVAASLIAFSRPYVGVHYPFDILGGAAVGILIGYLFSIAALKADKILIEKNINLDFKKKN